MISRWTLPFLLCVCLLPAARAQDADATSPDEIVEHILELQRQIDELMASLPPEVRDQVRRRLAEGDVAEVVPARPVVAPQAESSTAIATTDVAPVAVVAPLPPAAPEPPAAESPAETTTATAPADTPASDGIPKLIERRRRSCNTLDGLDENGDGKISAADRYWRYVYLWTDKNGDGRLDEREVESAYDKKVREIALSLETFIRAKGNLGEIRVEDYIVLDLRGDGFSERSRGDDGALAVDADALARGDGPRLLDEDGQALSGYHAFRAGLRIEVAGAVTELSCP